MERDVGWDIWKMIWDKILKWPSLELPNIWLQTRFLVSGLWMAYRYIWDFALSLRDSQPPWAFVAQGYYL